MRRISCFHWNRPRSTPLREEKTTEKGPQIGQPSENPEARVNFHCLPFFLLTCNHWKIKLMTYDLRLSYQRDIKICNILCFTETWLNKDTDNIELAGYSMHPQNRDATSGKTRGGVVCLFINNSWWVMSHIKEVSRYYSPEVECLMISCRPHYLPRDFSSVLFVAVYLPPQN